MRKRKARRPVLTLTSHYKLRCPFLASYGKYLEGDSMRQQEVIHYLTAMSSVSSRRRVLHLFPFTPMLDRLLLCSSQSIVENSTWCP